LLRNKAREKILGEIGKGYNSGRLKRGGSGGEELGLGGKVRGRGPEGVDVG